MRRAGIFARTARGVGIQHRGASRLAGLTFPVPPLAEQRRIAVVVEGRLAELREAGRSLRSALRRIAEQNSETLAAAAAGELVVPEAVLAQREGRPFEGVGDLPRTASNGGKQPPLFDRERTVVPVPEGRVTPPGWTWARVNQVGEVTLGRMREPKRHHGRHMRPYLRVANVYEDRIDTADVKKMNFTPEEYEVYGLRRGDILLNEGQSPELVGRPAMYRDEVPGACFQNTLLRFRAGPGVDPDFALVVFRHYLHAGEFRKAARWSTNIAHLSRQRFAAMPFPIPPLGEQRRIAAEARRRLDASTGQEAAIRASLGRLPAMEAELFATAVSGSLVPQDPTDEPATTLLARLGPPPPDALAPDTISPEESGAMPTPPSMNTEGAPAQGSSLAEVLRAAGRPLRLPELCHAAGYDRNSTIDIEQFYLALRTEFGRSIRPVGDAGENAEMEAIADAPG